MYNNVKSIRVKRGIKQDLPNNLPIGEPVFCVDTKELYMGMGEEAPVPIGITDLSNTNVEIQGREYNITDLLGKLVNIVNVLGNNCNDYLNNINQLKADMREFRAFMNTKGVPNGLAPLGSNNIVPLEYLPVGLAKEVIYSASSVQTSSYVFQLTGIDLTKYRRVEISHYAPHSCTSYFYVNGKQVTSISSTDTVSFVIENGKVTGNNGYSSIGSVAISPTSNTTLKWQYSSGCASPYYYDLQVIGYL